MTKGWVLIDGFARAYPMFVVLYSFLNGLLDNGRESILFGSYLLVMDIFNHILKHWVFKPMMKGKCWPILGYGCRPPKCRNTGLFKDGGVATSYGMPSGHAQISWIFTTYWILKLWNDGERSIESKILPIMLLLGTAMLVCYSRVRWAACHSVQQVIVGTIIGISLGFVGYRMLASKSELPFLKNVEKSTMGIFKTS